MAHEFVVMMGKSPQAKLCIDAWTDACIKFVSGQVVVSRGLVLKMPTCEEVETGPAAELAPLPFDEFRRRMKTQNRGRRIYRSFVCKDPFVA